jgi:hypothetical protein
VVGAILLANPVAILLANPGAIRVAILVGTPISLQSPAAPRVFPLVTNLPSNPSSVPPPPLGAGGGMPPAAAATPMLSEEQILRNERRRMVRERWLHLLLLGFALSIVVHVLILLRLWWIKLPERVDPDIPTVELKLQELPPTVEVTEDVELPDPSPLVMGPVSTEIDPLPNLSNDLASDNPNENSFGAIEAPGVGAIVGPGGAGSGIGIGSGKGGGGTSFFGIGGRGSRFAYIVDVSGSMEADNRMQTALSELARSVSALPDSTQYYVVLYSNGAILPPWDTGNWLRSTRSNIARTRQWLQEQLPQGGTYPLQAFERVFNLPEPPDVVFFLTDGEIPVDTAYHVKDFVDKLKRDVIINTVGFSSEAGKDPLMQIAKENRGVFRFVPTSGGAVRP